MLESVYQQVYELLKDENSGHGIDHITRVLELSLKFAEKEKADKVLVSLIALLHDVDDYKIFGMEYEKNLINAKRIMQKAKIDIETQNKVCQSLWCIGYSKSLKGIRPTSIEGKIVSDVDMCDALGAIGILRIYQYNLKHQKVFFDRTILPTIQVNAKKYKETGSDNGVLHFFDKILKLKNMMLTASGKEEAAKRHNMTVQFLYHLFKEENAFEWIEYLNTYLKKQEDSNHQK